MAAPVHDKRADLLIASCPRSGSTMLANALSMPPRSVVLHEPSLHRSSTFWLCHDQLKCLGYGGSRISRDTANWLSNGFKQWGVKECHHDRIVAARRALRPQQIILLVRNPRHMGRSMWERAGRMGKGVGARGSWIINAGRTLVAIAKEDPTNMIVVRYEDFVESESYRDALSIDLGWPLGGDVSFGLDAPKKNRMYESERNKGRISDISLRLREKESDGEAARWGDMISNSMAEYRETFGY